MTDKDLNTVQINAKAPTLTPILTSIPPVSIPIPIPMQVQVPVQVQAVPTPKMGVHNLEPAKMISVVPKMPQKKDCYDPPNPKVLLLIPTNNVKSYCMGKFYSNLKKLDLKSIPTDILISDDTAPGDDYKMSVESMGYEVVKVQKTVDELKRLSTLNPPQTLRVRDRLCNAREELRQQFLLRPQYTHALYIDSDIICPSDIIPKLIRHKKHIVSGVYWQYTERTNDQGKQYVDYSPVMYKFQDAETFKLWQDGVCPVADNFGATVNNNEIFPSRLIPDPMYYDALDLVQSMNESKRITPEERQLLVRYLFPTDIQVTAVGTGILMMSRTVMEDNWKFRYTLATPGTEDMWMSLDVKKLGYRIYVDTSLCASHWPKAWMGEKILIPFISALLIPYAITLLSTLAHIFTPLMHLI